MIDAISKKVDRIFQQKFHDLNERYGNGIRCNCR